ncbi:hypothetical protein G6F46_004850 [Rhizopus delemar]|uniref:Uncharacterized protein n=2 Tax=Rhizopus TaxID=4842 RepID=A0A9P6ZC94_9FUNG|nr:hypothetical protein G6F55_011793 [Rhizopus delemar]KAG1551391.1 hypothetical protein G6F51_001886 [Rhizopus arrhizus]KAG1491666.1 hypothetical protein G6F54_009852 [Rhizopus delemar]KAG1502345.1 hypothetical protein G6F52_012374 [Rhizopus delemar]KAG1513531.1 hypothetical protein G6F53_004367 [Rhizopus delemar]
MTSSSNTRSSRTKKPIINNVIGGDVNKSKSINKKKKQLRSKTNISVDPDRLQSQQQKLEALDITTQIDPSEHPDYTRLMNKLEESKQKKLKKIKMWKDHEHRLIFDWFASQKKQAWNDFYFDRKKARTMLIEQVHTKMLRIRQELSQLNMKSKTQYQEYDYSDGATNEEIDRDLTIAKQPYKGNNTPNLVYSDYESRSTTDTPIDEVDISISHNERSSRNEFYLYSHFNHDRQQQQQQQQQQQDW